MRLPLTWSLPEGHERRGKKSDMPVTNIEDMTSDACEGVMNLG